MLVNPSTWLELDGYQKDNTVVTHPDPLDLKWRDREWKPVPVQLFPTLFLLPKFPYMPAIQSWILITCQTITTSL